MHKRCTITMYSFISKMYL